MERKTAGGLPGEEAYRHDFVGGPEFWTCNRCDAEVQDFAEDPARRGGVCWASAWHDLANAYDRLYYAYDRLHNEAKKMSRTIDDMCHEPCQHCGKRP